MHYFISCHHPHSPVGQHAQRGRGILHAVLLQLPATPAPMTTTCLPIFDGAITSVFLSQHLYFFLFLDSRFASIRAPIGSVNAQVQFALRYRNLRVAVPNPGVRGSDQRLAIRPLDEIFRSCFRFGFGIGQREDDRPIHFARHLSDNRLSKSATPS
jgi:hypothetical protein